MGLEGGDVVDPYILKNIHPENYKRLLVWMTVVEDTTNGNVENVPEQKTILKTQVISDALIKIKPELADQKGRTIIIYSDGTTEIEGISE